MIGFRETVLRSLVLSVFMMVCCISFSANKLIESKPKYKNIESWLEFGKKHLRRTYRTGGTGPYAFDCSGFVLYMYKELGINLPHTSSGQAAYGYPVKSDKLRPGDLVFYAGSNKNSKTIGHVGIVYKVNKDGTFDFIHASVSSGIVIDNSMQEYYRVRYKTARRLVTDDDLHEALGIRQTKSEKESHPKTETPKHEDAKSDKPTVPQPSVSDKTSVTEKQTVKNDTPNTAVKDEKSKNKKKSKKGAKTKKVRDDDEDDFAPAPKDTDVPDLITKIKKSVKERKESTATKIDTSKTNNGAKTNDVKANSTETTQEYTYYTVKSGDTLYRIAKDAGMTVDDVIRINDLKDNNISVGQKLKIKNKQ